MRLLSTEASLLALLGVLLLGGQTSVNLGFFIIWGGSLLSCPGGLLMRTPPLPPRLWFPRRRPQQPPEFIHLIVEGLNLLPTSLGPHQLDSRYICLRVQLWQSMLAALVDHMLYLFMPWLWGMLKHLVEHHEVMGAICLPPSLPLKEQFNIHQSFCFSDWQTLPSCLPLVARALSLLLLYFHVSNLWYLKKMKEHYSTWN